MQKPLQAGIDVKHSRPEPTAALLSAIVESSDDAIISKTLDGIIISWNGGAEKIFGYAASEATGQPITLIIPPELRSEEDYVLDQIRRGEKVDHFETIRQTKDGRYLNISLTVSPVRDDRGVIIGASKIARDITEKRQLEREREQLLVREQAARERLSEALKVRDDFIAIAAHELRSPLNAAVISGYLLHRLCEREAGLAEIDRVVEKLRTELDRFTTLIDRLLDVTRLRTGTFELYCETFDLGSLVGEVQERFSNSRSVICLQLEPHIKGTWDRTRLDQAVTNLVSNAVKYGGDKPIVISTSTAGSMAMISVTDHGQGIPPMDQKRIFDRFERIGVKERIDGLGLGLWITKQIVEKHGGTIEVDSTIGKGSTFMIKLPRER